MIIIQALLKVNPTHRDEFLEKTKPVIEGTLAEEGNISYRLYEDAEEPNTFVMLEKWKDQQVIAAHRQSAHFLAFVNEAKALLLAPLQADIFEVVEKQ
jgi:quinol monooxygenase YgiN